MPSDLLDVAFIERDAPRGGVARGRLGAVHGGTRKRVLRRVPRRARRLFWDVARAGGGMG
jgi:hypothetical protein